MSLTCCYLWISYLDYQLYYFVKHIIGSLDYMFNDRFLLLSSYVFLNSDSSIIKNKLVLFSQSFDVCPIFTSLRYIIHYVSITIYVANDYDYLIIASSCKLMPTSMNKKSFLLPKSCKRGIRVSEINNSYHKFIWQENHCK